MRWQRAARWFVAVAGVGTAVALYVQTEERPVIDRPAIATPSDPEASVQSSGGTTTRFRDGDVEISIAHEGETIYPDGRIVWRQARIEMGDGTTLAAGSIEMSGEQVDGQPAALRLQGGVEMTTPEGASVRGPEATYDHATGVAILPGPVSFTRGRINGRGTGGEYYRETGIFRILADARIEIAPDGADTSASAVKASAETLTFNRATQALLFERAVEIVHTSHRMTADRATLYLADDQERFRVIELRGRAAVLPVTGQQSTVPEMKARDIDLAFYEGTEALERAVLVGGSSVVLVDAAGRRSIEAVDITMTTAPDGQTVTSIDARERVVVRTPARPDQAGRTISSARLAATGTDAGLTDATFSGGVRFEETVPGGRGSGGQHSRTAQSRTLVMALDGQFDRVRSARFDQGVSFRDGDLVGDADVGEYDAVDGRLVLRPARGSSKVPHVESERVTVDAREFIDVDLDTGSLHARGDVKTVSRGTADTPRTSAGLLNASDTVLGFSTEFDYDADARQARYVGGPRELARVTQADTAISARSVELAEQTEDLTAEGDVDSTFVAAASNEEPSRKYRVQAAALDYRHGARTATYTGTPVTLTAPDGVTRAQTMVLTLAPEGRTLERLEARTDVHATLPSGREALADSLLYDASTGRYTLRGTRGRSQVVLRAPGERAGTCTESRGLMVYFTSGGEPPVFPADQNPGSVNHVNVACSAPLSR